ncbi:MAG: MOSC domain-containing protein [Paracoccaceae bacterium]
MPALIPTDHSATIVWMGVVPHRERQIIDGGAVEGEMPLSFAGYEAEVHAGRTRPSDGRVVAQHPRGTEIANVRQVSIVSEEELALIAAELDLPRVDPRWLGASLVLRGLADLSHLPPSSRLQGPDGTTLIVDMMNHPCKLVSMTIEDARPGHGRAFTQAAEGRRGVTAWVERPGTLRMGDELRLHVPGQRAWEGGALG